VSTLTGGLTGGVLATVGNVVMNTGPLGGLGTGLETLGGDLKQGGLAGLPSPLGGVVGQVVAQGDKLLSPLAKVVVLNNPAVGSSSPASMQLIGASIAATNQTVGQLATAGVLTGGNLANLQLPANNLPLNKLTSGAGTVLDPVLTPVSKLTNGLLGQGLGSLLNVDIAGTTLLGNASKPAIGLNVLAPATGTGSTAAVNLLSGNQLLSTQVASNTGLLAPVGTLLGDVKTGVGSGLGNVLTPVSGLLGGLKSGSSASSGLGGVLAPVTGLLGGATGGSSSSSGLGAVLTPVVNTVTSTVSGATGGSTGGSSSSSGGLLGGLLGGGSSSGGGLLGGLLGGGSSSGGLLGGLLKTK
jgi:hypothetical protein